MPDENDPKADEIQVKLNFRIPPRMPSVYAHHMYIQQGQNEVVISFFEVVPPVMTEQATEDRLRTLQEIGVVAECVARVTVAKESFPAFAKAMQQVANQISTPEVQETQDADNTRNNPKS